MFCYTPHGIIEDVLVNVSDFYYLVDFIVLDTQSTNNCAPIILGRPLLATVKAHIDCANGKMTLTFENLTVKVNIFNLMH